MNRILSLTVTALVAMAFAGPVPAWAQTDQERIEELRQQIEELERQAEQYRDGIASERAKADTLKREIGILKNQILNLEAKIQATGKKIDKTKIEIEGVQGRIFDTQQLIGQRRAGIGRIILFLDQTDRESLVATLLKNDSLSVFFRQTQYAANLNTQLLDLIVELKDMKADLEESQQDLEGKQTELERLNQEQRTQRSSLGLTKTSKDRLLVETKGQEAEYQKRLADVEERKAEFFTELLKLEKSVVAGGRYLVRVRAESVPPKGTKLFRWPEEGYYITQGYGCTRYARCNNRRGPYGGAPHNGIDIAAGYGSPIFAIGDGQIIANGQNTGWGNWVAIRHPNDLVSVYGHMSSLSLLRVGTEVKAGAIIGYEGSTGNVTGSHLHLSLYREFFTYVSDKNDQLYFNYFEGSLDPRDYLY